MIGVIGCGNMAGAIVRGIHRVYPNEKFLTFTPSYTRAERLAQDVGGEAVKSLSELKDAKEIIIGCKPQQFAELSKDLKSAVELSSVHIISIMAAVPLETIEQGLGAQKVTRIMPNTPSLYNEGVSLMISSAAVSEDEAERVKALFSACSKVHPMESEKIFDQVTTVSGSGPAYVFYFAKTMAEKLQSWGQTPEEARAIVNQLFKGASLLMEKSSETSLDELVNQVTSKGGVTIEAVKTYQAGKLDNMTSEALDAAFARSIELTDSFRN